MNDHPLCCDCDECLNGAGGYTLPGAGAVTPTPSDARRRGGARPRLDHHRAALLEREEATRLEWLTARNDLKRLALERGGRE
jgi:hypothetical protein